MHLVDQAGTQILLDRRSTAGKPHVLTVRRLVRTLQGSFDAIGHEVEDGAALKLHPD